jgi:hypothetical protein
LLGFGCLVLFGSLPLEALFALPEPVNLAIGFQDMDAMRQPVEQSSCVISDS